VVVDGVDLRVVVVARRPDRRAEVVTVPSPLETVGALLAVVSTCAPVLPPVEPVLVVATGGRGCVVVILAVLVPITNVGIALPLPSTREGSPVVSDPTPD
jgi:hypothetical protein